MQLHGYVGLIALALCWVPQSFETIKLGKSPVNLTFLLLSPTGSFFLALYAFGQGDMIFLILNSLTTLGALINVYL